MRHPLTKVRLLRAMPGHRIGDIVTVRGKKAEYLIRHGHAEILKEEKITLVTKEEKFIPETKEEPLVKDFSATPVRQLGEIISDLSDDDLLNIVKSDERKTAVRLASDELKRRG
jgi:hypothetical protein